MLTQTTINNLKRRAKRMVQSGSWTHSDALNELAKEYHFHHWAALMKAQKVEAPK